MSTRSIPERLVQHLNPVLPDGVRVETPGRCGGTFGIYASDGWWGDVGIEFNESSAGEELAVRLEIYLDGIQDTIVHIVNGSWPDLEAGALPSPWARVSATAVEFGFGRIACDPILLGDTNGRL